MGFFARLKEDLDAARSHDPAARGSFENFFAYSGLHAIWIHRLTHRLWQNPALRFPARLLSQLGRFLTGIEIHPGATIGRDSAVGANAVVVKDAPPESIVTGVPAKWRHRDAQRETTPAVDPAEYDIEYRI